MDTILARMPAAQNPMTESPSRLEVEDLQQNLRRVQERLAQQGEPAAHLPTLRADLDQLHPADVAYILEALPLEERLVVWDLVKAEREGEILLEVSEAVRESLIATMDSQELVAAAETLEADEIADLAPDLPEEVVQDVIRALPQEERVLLRAALSYDEGTVGALMDFDQVTVRADVSLEAATRYLRALEELPAHTDQLFVVDRGGKLLGTLPLARLIVTDLERQVGEVMVPESVQAQARGPRRGRRAGVRALRPRVGAGGGSHFRQPDWPRHVNTVDGPYPRAEARRTSSLRPACRRKRMYSPRCGTASATAGPGWRSTW
jgi:CBS domain-containing protein